jgi:hypothetical protein
MPTRGCIIQYQACSVTLHLVQSQTRPAQEVCPSVEQLCDIAANCFRVSCCSSITYAQQCPLPTEPPSSVLGDPQPEDVLRMELLVLDTLSWRAKTPTAYTFLHLYAQALPSCSYSTVCLSSYLLVRIPASRNRLGFIVWFRHTHGLNEP